MYSGARAPEYFYLLKGTARLARPSTTEVLSVASETVPVSSSSIPFPVGEVSSIVGMVAWVVGAVEGAVEGIVVGREVGVLVVPGMELTTAEDIHVVCLFPSIETAESFDRYVYGCLPPIPNREKIFGEQLLCDAEDNVVGKEERLLITATSIGLDTVPELVASYGGVAFLAHIDRKSNGALAILGSLSEDLGFDLAEVSKLSRPADYAGRFPFLSFVGDSDAHQLTDIAEGGGDNELAAAFESATDVVEYFRNIAKK